MIAETGTAEPPACRSLDRKVRQNDEDNARHFELHFCLDDESYFEALVRMFGQALKTIDTMPQTQRPALLARLDVVRQINHQFGYGVGEDMDSLLESHGGYG